MERISIPETAAAPPKPRGRHRSVAAHTAILKATLNLLERHPLADITADDIVKKAGVSKATLYKWWPNKNRVALDAILSRAKIDVPIADTGSALTDFTEHFKTAVGFYNSALGKAVVEFLAQSLNDQAMQKLFRDHFQLPRRIDLKTMFDRAISRGEIRPDIDIELVIDMLFAPIAYRLMAGHMPVDESVAIAAVQTLFRGIQRE